MVNYFTHDNGGKPFKVNISNESINVFNNETEKKLLTIKNYVKVFIGNDPEYPGSKGNSILVRVNEENYVYIGTSIYQFKPKEKILKFYSPLGNSDVVYSYGISENFIYLFAEKKVVKKQDVPPNEDPYYLMYQNFISSKKFRVKEIQRRLY
jgi:hypothetical protein